MKHILFISCLILLFTLKVHAVLQDYCNLLLETEECSGNQHLGCERMLTALKPSLQNQRNKTFFDRMVFGSYLQKTKFTDKINSFRMSIAKNEFKILNEVVANMKVVKWNEELQLFAVYSINHRSMHSPKFCANTNLYKNVSRFNKYFRDTKQLSAEALMDRFFKAMETTIRANRKGRERFSPFIDADTEAIGCAFAKYRIRDDDPENVVMYTHVAECYINQPRGRSFEEIYTRGPTCSKCACSEKCSINFPALCEYREMLFQVTPLSQDCLHFETVDVLFSHFYFIYIFVIFSGMTYAVFILYHRYLYIHK